MVRTRLGAWQRTTAILACQSASFRLWTRGDQEQRERGGRGVALGWWGWRVGVERQRSERRRASRGLRGREVTSATGAGHGGLGHRDGDRPIRDVDSMSGRTAVSRHTEIPRIPRTTPQSHFDGSIPTSSAGSGALHTDEANTTKSKLSAGWSGGWGVVKGGGW